MYEKILLICVIITALVNLRDTFTLPNEVTFGQKVMSTIAPTLATAMGISIAWLMVQYTDKNRFDFTVELITSAGIALAIYFALRRATRYETTFWQGVEHCTLSLIIGMQAAVVGNNMIWAIDSTIGTDHVVRIFFIGSSCLAMKQLAALRPSKHTRLQS